MRPREGTAPRLRDSVGEAELSSLRGKEGPWGISRPNRKGPLLPPSSCSGSEHLEAVMSPSLRRQCSPAATKPRPQEL